MDPPPATIYPANVDMRPDVARLTETGAVFKDGSEQTYSLIFYCTGYKFTFPFLSADCGVHVDNNYVQSLYKHCINIENPTLSIIGLPFHVCAGHMNDLQARFVLKYLTGGVRLPSREEMQTDTDKEMGKRWADGLKKRQAHRMGPLQVIPPEHRSYKNVLMNSTRRPPTTRIWRAQRAWNRSHQSWRASTTTAAPNSTQICSTSESKNTESSMQIHLSKQDFNSPMLVSPRESSLNRKALLTVSPINSFICAGDTCRAPKTTTCCVFFNKNKK